MKYDIIIIGAGPAGLSCGLQIAKAGRSCLILEKRETLTGKVCGDGLSSHCVEILKQIGIHETDLAALGGKKIFRNITSASGRLEQRNYRRSEGFESFAWGLSRDVFDPYLGELAQKAGAEIRTGWKACEVRKTGSGYLVDGHLEGTHVVLACGASGGGRFGLSEPKNLPVGISARVSGDCILAPDAFYFKYDRHFGSGYAWLFPVGEKLWNYGVWSADRQKDIKRLFEQVEQKLIRTWFSDCRYERKPGGALIGAAKGWKNNFWLSGIGDCAYSACFESGEGISFAIESGYHQAMAILENRKSESVRVPEQWSFCNEVRLLSREAFVMGDGQSA